MQQLVQRLKEQGSSGLKKSAGKLNCVWDPVNAELSVVVEYLDKFNDMCVAKVMPGEEKSQRRAAEPCSPREFKEALSILSESALFQWLTPCSESTSISFRH